MKVNQLTNTHTQHKKNLWILINVTWFFIIKSMAKDKRNERRNTNNNMIKRGKSCFYFIYLIVVKHLKLIDLKWDFSFLLLLLKVIISHRIRTRKYNITKNNNHNRLCYQNNFAKCWYIFVMRANMSVGLSFCVLTRFLFFNSKFARIKEALLWWKDI